MHITLSKPTFSNILPSKQNIIFGKKSKLVINKAILRSLDLFRGALSPQNRVENLPKITFLAKFLKNVTIFVSNNDVNN